MCGPVWASVTETNIKFTQHFLPDINYHLPTYYILGRREKPYRETDRIVKSKHKNRTVITCRSL